jgi:hypothetical protein
MSGEDTRVIVDSVAPLSVHQKAVADAGERLLLESVQTGREFCKAMVGISFAAVPTYVGLLKLFLPDNVSPLQTVGSVWMLPVALYLLAATVSVGGYLPSRTAVSLDLPEEIEKTLRMATSRRFWCGVAAFSLLAVGVSASLAVLQSI